MNFEDEDEEEEKEKAIVEGDHFTPEDVKDHLFPDLQLKYNSPSSLHFDKNNKHDYYRNLGIGIPQRKDIYNSELKKFLKRYRDVRFGKDLTHSERKKRNELLFEYKSLRIVEDMLKEKLKKKERCSETVLLRDFVGKWAEERERRGSIRKLKLKPFLLGQEWEESPIGGELLMEFLDLKFKKRILNWEKDQYEIRLSTVIYELKNAENTFMMDWIGLIKKTNELKPVEHPGAIFQNFLYDATTWENLLKSKRMLPLKLTDYSKLSESADALCYTDLTEYESDSSEDRDSDASGSVLRKRKQKQLYTTNSRISRECNDKLFPAKKDKNKKEKELFEAIQSRISTNVIFSDECQQYFKERMP
jgi:hypothetical protein